MSFEALGDGYGELAGYYSTENKEKSIELQGRNVANLVHTKFKQINGISK